MVDLMGSSEALKDRYDFMKFQVFQWLIGATDGHAKNFSVFIQAGGSYRLTPFYDIISAFPVLGGTGIHISDPFASAVTGRFRNPYIKHQLLSIALNGMTKFRTRILPQLLAGQKANGTLPARLTFALAALIAFYRGERNGETYPVQDDAHWLERYQQLWSQHRDRVTGTQELVAIVLAEKDHWEQDLTQVPGLVEQVANDLDAILEKGMREAVRPLC
ncbi:HipA domain-containing protein [Escherichia coli]|uniref:mannitol dehydrogenase family protein n=1 Tax=Escherichia coli TaxID=562 RepID=UPI003B9B2317